MGLQERNEATYEKTRTWKKGEIGFVLLNFSSRSLSQMNKEANNYQ
jgi:hypothetical protein